MEVPATSEPGSRNLHQPASTERNLTQEFNDIVRRCNEISKKSARDSILRNYRDNPVTARLCSALNDVHENCQHVSVLGADRIAKVDVFILMARANLRQIENSLQAGITDMPEVLGFAAGLDTYLLAAIASMKIRKALSSYNCNVYLFFY